MGDTRTMKGGCHCGAVRFEAEIDLSKPASRCNCTYDTKAGGAVAIVKPAAFKLLSGEDKLTDYVSKEGSPNHFPFCKVCGIHAFGTGNIPEIGGEYVAVNVNCLDDVDPAALKYEYWDGRNNNWDAGTKSEPWPITSR